MNASKFNHILDSTTDISGVRKNIKSVIGSNNPTYMSLFIQHMYRIGVTNVKLDIILKPLMELKSSCCLVRALPYIHLYQRDVVLKSIVENGSLDFVKKAIKSCKIENTKIADDFIERNDKKVIEDAYRDTESVSFEKNEGLLNI